MPSTTQVSATGNADVDGLLSGVKWDVARLSYSFPAMSLDYELMYGNGEQNNNFSGVTAAQEGAIRAALAQYGAVSNLSFVEAMETPALHADLRFGQTDTASTAYAYLPQSVPEGGDAWFNNSTGAYDRPVKGNYAYITFLHEIGHTLGLKHGHDTGDFGALPHDHDSMEYSVMTYRSYVGATVSGGYTNETWGFAQSLMQDDIAAIQSMYGADYATQSGNSVYQWSPSSGEMFIDGVGQGKPGANVVFLTVWDGGGNDTYDLSNYSSDLTVDLQPGAWTRTSKEQRALLSYDGKHVATGNIANALEYKGDSRSLIENATGGSGNDTITGNAAGNMLKGGQGDDVLRGKGGADVLYGGHGVDTLYGSSDSDKDRFLFRSIHDSGTGSSDRDTIGDFDRKSSASETVWDRIDLRSIDADHASGDQSFRFVSKFHTASKGSPDGEVTIDKSGSGCKVLVDIDGDKHADMIVHVTNAGTLHASDFLL